MCTAIIEVPHSNHAAVRVLAVRDEDPNRAWDAPGMWWPQHPDVVGVRDRLAGGAWLAAGRNSGRVAMILNRAETTDRGLPQGPNQLASRGALVLDDVAGRELTDEPRTANFNLVSANGARATITSWDGQSLEHVELEPGVHMVAHFDVDDAARTPRIARWLPEFQSLAGLSDDEWRAEWIKKLAESAALPAEDDRAIIRDNRTHGYPTLSLLCCLVETRGDARRARESQLRIDTAVFDGPGHWHHPTFEALRF